MKRRTTSQQQHNLDWATPVQQNRNERAGFVSDAGIPAVQSGLVSAALVNLALSFLALVVIGGEVAFWLGAGSISVAAFFWIIAVLKRSVSFVAPRDRGAASILMTCAAFLLAGLGGAFSWCVAVVAMWAVPNPTIAPWIVFSWFIFALSFWGHLEITLLQRLLQPWAFQRQFVWKAIGALLQAFGLHVIEKGVPRAQDTLPEREIVITVRDEVTESRTHHRPPVNDRVFTEVCHILYDKTFNYDNLCGNGNPIPGGQKGRAIKDELRQWMIDNGFLMWNQIDSTTGEGMPKQGVRLTELGQDMVMETIGGNQ